MPVVRIRKLVAGGQGLADLPDGRKVFVWGGLPGEEADIAITDEKKSYATGVVIRVIQPSTDRIAPREESYLAHSPWQILTMDAENRAKVAIVCEQFTRAGIAVGAIPAIVSPAETDGYGYRNKMEYVFAEQSGALTLAIRQRDSHSKIPVVESALALPSITTAAQEVLAELNRIGASERDMDSVILRASQQGEVVAALYINHPRYKKLLLPPTLKGLRVYYHNPRHRRRRGAKLVQELGENTVTDTILGRTFHYDVHSFFQVNVPVYETALRHMQQYITGPVVDMYAGVGSIGLSVAGGKLSLVEIDPANVAMARRNAAGVDANVVESSVEKALERIERDTTIIFDPPRAGLQRKIIERCLSEKPARIVYLSCDPATLVRDVTLLSTGYSVVDTTVYNFFPRTPHIETLAVLELEAKK